MLGADISTATLIAGIIVANIGLIIGAYVSVRVAIARLEVKVDGLENDVNNLGGLYRSTKQGERNHG